MHHKELWLRYAAGSCAGRKAGGTIKVNQDSYCVQTRMCGLRHAHLFAVFDGHGKHGHQVSAHLRARLPTMLASELSAMPAHSLFRKPRQRFSREQQAEELSALARVLKRVLNELEREVFSSSEFNADLSGSTAVILLLLGRHAVVANAGDSRCVLVSLPRADADGAGSTPVPSADGGEGKVVMSPSFTVRSSPELVARTLTLDQKPDDPAERARIDACGGYVQPIFNPTTGAFVGPARVWSTKVPGRLPGLAMSRSVGDRIATDVGVISDPVVTYHYLRPERDRFLVLASDGLWEFSDCQSAADILGQCPDPTDAAVALCSHAQQKWMQEMSKYGSAVVDDITALVLALWPSQEHESSASDVEPPSLLGEGADAASGSFTSDDASPALFHSAGSLAAAHTVGSQGPGFAHVSTYLPNPLGGGGSSVGAGGAFSAASAASHPPAKPAW